jgi:hypothetical protein
LKFVPIKKTSSLEEEGQEQQEAEEIEDSGKLENECLMQKSPVIPVDPKLESKSSDCFKISRQPRDTL